MKKNMKICLVYSSSKNTGGLILYVKRIEESLKKSGVITRSISFDNPLGILNKFNAINSYNPDLIRVEYTLSTFGPNSIFLFIVLLYLKMQKHVLLTVNYHEPKREIEILPGIGNIFYSFFSIIFDRIYVHTTEAKYILVNKCKIPTNKIKVIPHGTYVFKDKTDYKTEIIRKYNIKDKIVLLYFGYIHVDKGIEYLLKAIKLIVDEDPTLSEQIIVLIAGSVRKRSLLFKVFEHKDILYLQNLQRLKTKLELGNVVKFIGFIKGKYVYSLLKSSKIIILPYTNAEQSGVLNLALAANIPVIATKVGGLRETLSKCDTLVPPRNSISIADKIKLLLKDRNYYESISHNIFKISKEQNNKKVCEVLIQDFTLLMSKRVRN